MALLPAAYQPASEFLCARRNLYTTLQYHPREHFQWVSEFPIISFLKQQKSQLFPGICAMAQRRTLLLPSPPDIQSQDSRSSLSTLPSPWGIPQAGRDSCPRNLHLKFPLSAPWIDWLMSFFPGFSLWAASGSLDLFSKSSAQRA